MAVKTVLENFAKDLKNTLQAQKNIVDVSANYIEALSKEDIGDLTPEEMEAVTGDLDDLTTTDKNNLVSAINEVQSDIVTTIEPAIAELQKYSLGSIVYLNDYDSASNQYTTTSDGYIFVNAYSGNVGFIMVNNSFSIGTNDTTITQATFSCFVKKGTELYVTQVSGAPNLSFNPLV